MRLHVCVCVCVCVLHRGSSVYPDLRGHILRVREYDSWLVRPHELGCVAHGVLNGVTGVTVCKLFHGFLKAGNVGEFGRKVKMAENSWHTVKSRDEEAARSTPRPRAWRGGGGGGCVPEDVVLLLRSSVIGLAAATVQGHDGGAHSLLMF